MRRALKWRRANVGTAVPGCPSSAARLVLRFIAARSRESGLRPEDSRGRLFPHARGRCQSGALRDSLRLKREDRPSLPVFFEMSSIDILARKFRDGARPELERRNIRLHHANIPRSREPPPYFMRDPSSSSAPPVCSKNEELGHIPYVRVPRDLRPFLH